MRKNKAVAAVGLTAALGILVLSGCGNGSGYRVVDMTSARDGVEASDEENAAAGNGTEAASEATGEEAMGIESGSDTEDYTIAGSGTYGIGDKVTILGNVAENGEYQYVEVQVNSVAVMQDQIEGVNEEAFQYIPDTFGVSEDGTITSEYSFVAVGISLYSDIDMEVCLALFKLKVGYNYKDSFYNSSPAESDNAKRSGYTKVSARG